MTDFEIAVSRLTAWLRDYQDVKAKAFIGDVTLVLIVAKESQKIREQRDELLAACEAAIENFKTYLIYGPDRVMIEKAIEKAKGEG